MKRLRQNRENFLIVGFVLVLFFLHSLHLSSLTYRGWLSSLVLATNGLLLFWQVRSEKENL